MDSGKAIEDAKGYMARKQVYQLFESMLTGLVHNQPEDPVDFLQQCLQKVKENRNGVKWDSFLRLDDKQSKLLQTDEKISNFDKIFDTEAEIQQQ
ncbi:adenylate kinase isoenzyme 5 [Nematostella vectensis]|uniref:adenylate kinase isoenzyme 5 n=1 Tax=Nematostella vectensis TaxID=45351 RepID=UPI002076DA44|nr:adenylate kinase isoenzyme 5 [Nematostella vectensis]